MHKFNKEELYSHTLSWLLLVVVAISWVSLLFVTYIFPRCQNHPLLSFNVTTLIQWFIFHVLSSHVNLSPCLSALLSAPTSGLVRQWGGPVVIFCRFTGLKILFLPFLTVEPNVLPPSLTLLVFHQPLHHYPSNGGTHWRKGLLFSHIIIWNCWCKIDDGKWG